MASNPFRSDEKSSYSNPFRSDEKPKRNKKAIERTTGRSTSKTRSSRKSSSSNSSNNFNSITEGEVSVDRDGNIRNYTPVDEPVASRVGGGVITASEARKQSTALRNLQSRSRGRSSSQEANFNDMERGAIQVSAPEETTESVQQRLVRADRQAAKNPLFGVEARRERTDRVTGVFRNIFDFDRDTRVRFTPGQNAESGVGRAGNVVGQFLTPQNPLDVALFGLGGAAGAAPRTASKGVKATKTALDKARSTRAGSFAVDTAGVVAQGVGVGLAGERAIQATRPDDLRTSEAALDEAFRQASQASTTGQGTLRDVAGAVSPFFGSKEEFQKVARQQLREEGLRGQELDRTVQELTRQRTVAGSFEAANLLNIARASERVGRRNVVQAFENAGVQNIPKSRAGIQTAKTVFFPIAQAGVAEGTASVAAQNIGRGQPTSAQELLFGAGIGGASAGVLGSVIGGTAINKPATSKGVEIFTNFIDPFEKPGDIAQNLVEKGARKAGREVKTPTITVMGANEPNVQFGTSKANTPTEQMAFDLAGARPMNLQNTPVIPYGGTTPTQTNKKRSGRGSRTPTNVPVNIADPTSISLPTPPNIPTNIITGDGARPTPVPVPRTPTSPTLTPTAVPINVPAAIPVNINIPTPTALPRIPPPIPLGFPAGTGGAGTVGNRGTQFVNELAASQELLRQSFSADFGFNPQPPKKRSKSKGKKRKPANPLEELLSRGII